MLQVQRQLRSLHHQTNRQLKRYKYLTKESKTILLMGGSPGLVVIVADSHAIGRGFESLLDGHFSHYIIVKIVKFVWKDGK